MKQATGHVCGVYFPSECIELRGKSPEEGLDKFLLKSVVGQFEKVRPSRLKRVRSADPEELHRNSATDRARVVVGAMACFRQLPQCACESENVNHLNGWSHKLGLWFANMEDR